MLFAQVVDMRWGVRDEMTNEHMTTALCMTEVCGYKISCYVIYKNIETLFKFFLQL